jgi:hypothetical protein
VTDEDDATHYFNATTRMRERAERAERQASAFRDFLQSIAAHFADTEVVLYMDIKALLADSDAGRDFVPKKWLEDANQTIEDLRSAWNDTRAALEQCREALSLAKHCVETSDAVVDTIWAGPAATLVDRIEAALARADEVLATSLASHVAPGDTSAEHVAETAKREHVDGGGK